MAENNQPPQQPVAAVPPPGTVPQGYVPVQQPVVYIPTLVEPQAASHTPGLKRQPTNPEQPQTEPLELKIISHSPLFYWWPIWVVGYIMALLTYLDGVQVQIGNVQERFHPNSNLGVIFFLVLFTVILITNVVVRGLASGMVVLAVILATVLLAYFNLWDVVLGWLGNLKIHLNLGAYIWFSTLMFIVWALAVFVFDRMNYWEIKPGQITREAVLGAGSVSYDTNGMTLEKYRGDIFRHWILGLGSGDLHIQTTGATRDRIDLPNVLFIGSKIALIQRMIAERPNEFGNATLK
jgi:hypothetical protein